MDYKQIIVSCEEKVGMITLNNPPRNDCTKRMITEMLDVLNKFEQDEKIWCVMINAKGSNFSGGAEENDLINEMWDQDEGPTKTFAELGGEIVERLDCYPKPTLVAARGLCRGGSTTIFNACDIRIAGESFNMKDGDIYYGLVGSWGMSSLRLPIWIGRNKVMDYMFLNEGFTGRQCYELGLVSKVVPDDQVDEIGLSIAKKMATAAPVAVRYYKECVRKSIYHNLQDARAFELEASEKVYETEDSKIGIKALFADKLPAPFIGK